VSSRRHWTVAVLTWLLIAGSLGYIGLVGALYFSQRSLMYFPSAKRIAPADAGLPQAQEVVLDTSDGEKLIAWYVPPQAENPVVIFFHGNGDTLAGLAQRFREITAAGVGLVGLSFRGYNGSTGHPTEEGLHRDAMAAYEFAAARYSPDRIVLWGFSLGTGAAVALAAKRPIAKLVLEAPYTSTVDVAASIFPFVPVRLLMKDQFHSDEQIKNVKAPILIVHAEHDQTIPISFGERLFAMAAEPKRFVRFPRGRHEDLGNYGVVGVVLRFLSDQEP
jgi:fermentation-respiration switch protein FrsA (DUF1100 family)